MNDGQMAVIKGLPVAETDGLELAAIRLTLAPSVGGGKPHQTIPCRVIPWRVARQVFRQFPSIG